MSNDFEMEDLKLGDERTHLDSGEVDTTLSLWAWNSTILFVDGPLAHSTLTLARLLSGSFC